MRVLVVEDEKKTASFIRKALQAEGFAVDVCHRGDEALALAGLAGERGLRHLSMGTSQDYVVAVEEGATIVRLGTRLYA